MKKDFLVLAVGITLILGAIGFGLFTSPARIDKIATEVTTESVVSDNTTEATTEVKEEKIVFTKEMAESVKSYLKKYTSMDVIQQMTNGDTSGVKYSDVMYTINCDLKNKIIQTTITDNSEETPTSKYYLDNVAEDLHFTRKDENSEWKEAKGKTLVLDSDIKKYKTTLDLYNYLINGNSLKEGVEGTISDKYYYFEEVTPAKKEMLSGVEYDKLGNHTVTHIFMSEDGKEFIPVSVIVTVDFMVGDKKYDVTSTVQFVGAHNNELSSPNLEKKESDSSESN